MPAPHALNAPLKQRPALVQRIRSEYLEMPGLTLTAPQAQRLWGLDEAQCTAVLGALVDAGFLKRTRGGYCRASAA